MSIGLTYVENKSTSAKAIADLREAIGWNRMENVYKNPSMTSYFHIAAMTAKSL